ncbi:hypothetical protein AB4Z17_25975 [Paenibacillus sp. TAF43_2]|uniref:hypothetical protein n=1 Tax=Paenibacillus sp. TAF43_2 TaxID=3233069 RepID=UPI003F94ED78
MAILKDINENGAFVEFSFIYRIPGSGEGSRLNFKYFESNNMVYNLDFGWTNLTIRNYIEAIMNFPVELHNGYFSSFENHLFGLQWKETNTSGIYNLRLFDTNQDFTLTVSKESIQTFGACLNIDWEKAPLH